ncbi:MAG TPA: AcvB/VirJ family lysyl-phosphatidylglycerol hydrolase [Rudaea sp.]|nr:AcvB/VirJ family lysyl-phosphatidylglycerol hydrolase [Rudaea sp.]
MPLSGAAATKLVHYGLFGNVHVAAPAGEPKRTIVFLSDKSGWDARAEAMVSALSDDGALVLGVDLPAYLAEMLSINDKCSFPAAHVEEMSDWMQRHQQLKNFANPLLIGDGAGATFAYAVDAQAPKGTFAALITLGYDFAFRLPKPVCTGDAGKVTTVDTKDARERPVGEEAWRVIPVKVLPNPWLPFPFALQARRSAALPLVESWLKNLELRVVGIPDAPAPGAGLVAAVDWLTAPAAAVPLPEDIADLPLIEVAAQGTPANRIAIIITGDGGWAGLDIAVADQLSRRGIAVVGLSSVKYFWQTRKPDEAADALTRIIGHYGAADPAADFIVIGYSFGAALSPVLINRLADAARERIAAQVLISPDAEAVFEIHVGDWFGSTQHEGAIQVLPEIAKTKVPVICVHGADEGADGFCLKLAGKPNVRQLELAGGHHYNGDYDKLGASIYGALPKRQP